MWPVAEGRYKIGNPDSPVAVCTMASVDLELPMDRVAIAGKCVTENLGIEKIIKNTVSNPKIRYMIFCGKESQGHFVSQAVLSLKENGVDSEKRIIGAKGGMPILKNLSMEEIERFREQVEPVDMSGEMDAGKILAKVSELLESSSESSRDGLERLDKAVNPKQSSDGLDQLKQAIHPNESNDDLDKSDQAVNPKSGGGMEMEEEVSESRAEEHSAADWVKDPQGFFTIYPNAERGEIVAEHHDIEGRMRNRITGKSAEDIYHHAIKNSLVSRHDHAAYLGRELAKAEIAMRNSLDYEQDADLKVSKANKEEKRETSMEPVREPETEMKKEPEKKPEISIDERMSRLLQEQPARRQPEKKPETRGTGRFLTYFKGYKEIQLEDSTNPDHEFRALLRDRGLSRVF